MTQNKKRKQSPIYSDQHHDGKMVDDENIESVLFDEMTTVNSKLISLGNNFKLVDNLYFASNDGMIDEFIGNMKQFMEQLDLHRKQVAFGKLNSDILMNVYQFMDTETLKNCCGLVSKLWRESLTGLKVKVRIPNTIANFLESSLVNHVTELKLIYIEDVSAFISLSNSTNLNQLKVLQFSFIELDTKCVEYLMKCNMPNLTELSFKRTEIAENDAIDLLNSIFISSVKKLELSSLTCDFTNNFYESVSESKYLNQITHFTLWNDQGSEIVKRIDLLLKDKINLEYLELYSYKLIPNLLMNGNYKNLKYLDIPNCQMTNQEFVNLLVSPNLPKLETIKVEFNSLSVIDNTVAVFPPNSQSSITKLDIKTFKAELFPSLFDHCPKLKHLSILPNEEGEKETTKSIYLQMMKSPCLSNLEFLLLDISFYELMEEIFMNPIYSNLKVLHLAGCEVVDMKFLSNCTNLVNLTLLDLSSCYVEDRSLIEECSKALKNNPTFSKLKCIHLPSG